jgi:hypothetical protein
LPGTTSRDRPAIDQSDGLHLTGDAFTAQGLLSEVGFNGVMEAARLASGTNA